MGRGGGQYSVRHGVAVPLPFAEARGVPLVPFLVDRMVMLCSCLQHVYVYRQREQSHDRLLLVVDFVISSKGNIIHDVYLVYMTYTI